MGRVACEKNLPFDRVQHSILRVFLVGESGFHSALTDFFFPTTHGNSVSLTQLLHIFASIFYYTASYAVLFASNSLFRIFRCPSRNFSSRSEEGAPRLFRRQRRSFCVCDH